MVNVFNCVGVGDDDTYKVGGHDGAVEVELDAAQAETDPQALRIAAEEGLVEGGGDGVRVQDPAGRVVA